jgi:hypothetical protein
MHRPVHAHLNLPPEDSIACAEASHQPLARFITTILADYLDDAPTTRPSRRAYPYRRRAA